ncbi:unnamed protein product [Diplocarpon coronariae]
MIEISRKDAILSIKIKSDFFSSIYQEFRRPLHGMLASAEFLLGHFWCANVLIHIATWLIYIPDTINDVLNYSKIYSFENAPNKQGTILNELCEATSLTMLCEDIVNGMVAVDEYRGLRKPSCLSNASSHLGISPPTGIKRKLVEFILDIENRDWDYEVQPGALRLIVMNILGSYQKYTDSGSILIQLRMNDTSQEEPMTTSGRTVTLPIRDTSREMFPEYVDRKLYYPYTQEDTFASGVGLGLSIV